MKVLAASVKALEQGRGAALVTIVGVNGSAPRSSGARMLVHEDGSIVGTVGGGVFEHEVIQAALAAITTAQPRRYSANLGRDLGMFCGGAMEAFIEPLIGQEQLIIYGGGHVGRAVAEAASLVDLQVTVVDDRAEQLDLLPAGVGRVHGDPRLMVDDQPQGMQTYHLVVTYNHQVDREILTRLVNRRVAWMGLIGSKSKITRIYKQMAEAGVDPALFRKISAPVGLDIGAETPAEIAVSILAEIVRVRRRCRRPPVPLCELPLPARDGPATPPALAVSEG